MTRWILAAAADADDTGSVIAAVLLGIAAVITALGGLIVGIRTSRQAGRAAVQVEKINAAVNNVPAGAASIYDLVKDVREVVERMERGQEHLRGTVEQHRRESHARFERLEAKVDEALVGSD